jgi:hypothetical protein
VRQDHTTHEGDVTLWFDVTVARPPSKQRRAHDSGTYWMGMFLEGGSVGRADPDGIWKSDAPAMLHKRDMGVESCHSVQVSSQALWQGSNPCLFRAHGRTGVSVLGFVADAGVQASVCGLLFSKKCHSASPTIALAAAAWRSAWFVIIDGALFYPNDEADNSCISAAAPCTASFCHDI